MDEIGVNAATTAITVLGRGTIATVVAVPLGRAATPPRRHQRNTRARDQATEVSRPR